MTNDELLLAMSNVMDEKLKSELQPIKCDIHDMKADIRNMKDDMQNMKDDMQNMKDDVQSLKDDMQNMKDDVQNMKDDVQNIKDDVQNMKEDILKTNLCLENIILPRLNTIESCYTDTYHRYRDNADKMESTYSDVELLKRVVSEHSERFQKLA